MKNILLVEDDNSLAKIYQIEFESKGYKVAVAHDGEESLAKVKTGEVSPDLILLDIMMPKMNGIEVLKILKTDTYKNIPVLMLTNFGQEDLIREAFNLGAVDYVLKYQITPQELVVRTEQILGITKSNWEPSS